MTDHEFFDEVRQFLHTWQTASLATVDAQGHPHAANVQFAIDEHMHLLFVSSPHSAHGQHIAVEPQVAMTIYAHTDDTAGPGKIHGLQLHGRCEMIAGADAMKHARDVYTRRFTFIAGNPALTERLRQEPFYRVTPAWLRWIDNRRGFGFRVERTLSI